MSLPETPTPEPTPTGTPEVTINPNAFCTFIQPPDINESISLNGLTISATGSGYVECRTSVTADNMCGNSNAPLLPVYTTWLGRASSYSYTLTFDSPVNNIRIAIAGLNSGETGSISVSDGTLTLDSLYACEVDIVGDQYSSNSASSGDAVIKLSSTNDYNSITFSGSGGDFGHYLALCSDSLVSSVTPTPTATPAATATPTPTLTKTPTPTPTATSVTKTVPGAPTDLNTVNGDKSVVLTWSAPVNNGGSTITNYTIQKKVSTEADSAFTNVTNASYVPPNTSIIVNGLINGTCYVFRVAAVNSSGRGSYSQNSDEGCPNITPSAPYIISGIGYNTSATITWRKPSNDGYVNGYNLQRKVSTENDNQFAFIASVLTLSYKDTELSTGTAYSYRVSAFNEVGESPYSNVITVGASGAPSAPNAPTVTIGPTGLVITWVAPNDNGSPITSYYVGRKLYRGTSTQTIYRGTSLSFIDKFATNGKTYIYNVFARNAKGAGGSSPWSTPTSWQP